MTLFLYPGTNISSIPLPTGAATEATLASILADTTSIDAKDFATETTLAAILADTTSLDGKDFATETTLAAILLDTASLDGKDFATQTTLASVLADTTAIKGKDFATSAKQDSLYNKTQAGFFTSLFDEIVPSSDATHDYYQTKLASVNVQLLTITYSDSTKATVTSYKVT